VGREAAGEIPDLERAEHAAYAPVAPFRRQTAEAVGAARGISRPAATTAPGGKALRNPQIQETGHAVGRRCRAQVTGASAVKRGPPQPVWRGLGRFRARAFLQG
jgi:hypothetical protein